MHGKFIVGDDLELAVVTGCGRASAKPPSDLACATFLAARQIATSRFNRMCCVITRVGCKGTRGHSAVTGALTGARPAASGVISELPAKFSQLFRTEIEHSGWSRRLPFEVLAPFFGVYFKRVWTR